MSMNRAFIEELKNEAKSTRKLLAIVPYEHFGWKPHEKSMSLGMLATHIANLTGWPQYTIDTDGLDLATMPKGELPGSTQELLDIFDSNLEKSLSSLETATDEQMMKNWKLSKGSHVILDLPKVQVLRAMCFNHVIHHRGQLTVFLRLLNVPIPGVYGPSADDVAAMAAAAN